MEPTVGRTVHYYPKQECVTPESMEKYAAIITQVNNCGKDDVVPTVELVTFGPNSVYFQHQVSFSEVPMHGHWSWPPRI